MNKKGKIETVLLVWISILLTIGLVVYLYNFSYIYPYIRESKITALEKEAERLYFWAGPPGSSRSAEEEKCFSRWLDVEAKLDKLKRGR